MEKDKYPHSVSASDYLPSDPESCKVMSQRAALYSQVPDAAAEETDYQLLITFKLGDDRHYGFSQLDLEEVIIQPRIVTVPCVPEFVAGIVNHSGRLVSVIDLGLLLGLKKGYFDEPAVIMVLKDEILLGLLVDKVSNGGVYGKQNPEAVADADRDYSDSVFSNGIVSLSLKKIFLNYSTHMEII